MVFVIDKKKQPQPMIHPAEARKLLRDGKAAVFRKAPFTIILSKEGPVPDRTYRLKIDYGSKHTGLAILDDGRVLWLGQIDHRTNIKDALDKRRGYRRRRRSANLRYRKPRFTYRSRQDGWLPPSLLSRVDNVKTVVRRLQKLAPVGTLSYENVKFDTQLIQDEMISGVRYQQGELAGYEVREYLLEKFKHQCAYCGMSGVPLEVEHIIPKSRGGTNRISNLAIACHTCNQKKGSMTAAGTDASSDTVVDLLTVFFIDECHGVEQRQADCGAEEARDSRNDHQEGALRQECQQRCQNDRRNHGHGNEFLFVKCFGLVNQTSRERLSDQSAEADTGNDDTDRSVREAALGKEVVGIPGCRSDHQHK